MQCHRHPPKRRRFSGAPLLAFAMFAVFAPFPDVGHAEDQTNSQNPAPASQTASSPEPGIKYPDFWGLDLSALFPNSGDKTISVIFIADDHESLIARVVVGRFLSSPSDYDAWNVDLIKQTKTRVPKNDSFLPRNTWLPDVLFLPTSDNFHREIRVINDYGRNDLNCGDPITEAVSAFDERSEKDVATIRIIARATSRKGWSVGGGLDCAPDTPARIMKTIATTGGGGTFSSLRDGTSLIEVGLNPIFLIRLDRDLATKYQSPNLLILSDKEYKKISRNLFDTQKTLLSMFGK